MIIWHRTALDWSGGIQSHLEWIRHQNGSIGVQLSATPMIHGAFIPRELLSLWEYINEMDPTEFPLAVPVSIVAHLFPKIIINFNEDAKRTGAPQFLVEKMIQKHWFDASSIGIHPPKMGKIMSWVDYQDYTTEFDLSHHLQEDHAEYQVWREIGWVLYGISRSDHQKNTITFTLHG